MLSLASASVAYTPAAISAPAAPRADVKMESLTELKSLAGKLNPGTPRPRHVHILRPATERFQEKMRLSPPPCRAAQLSATGTR